MKNILTIAVTLILLVVLSISAAGTPAKSQTPTSPKQEEGLAQLKKAMTELKAAVTRIEALEHRILLLEQANQKLQQEVKERDQPKLVPLDYK